VFTVIDACASNCCTERDRARAHTHTHTHARARTRWSEALLEVNGKTAKGPEAECGSSVCYVMVRRSVCQLGPRAPAGEVLRDRNLIAYRAAEPNRTETCVRDRCRVASAAQPAKL